MWNCCAVPLAHISEAIFSNFQYLSACVYFIEAKPECLEVPLRSSKSCLLISRLKKLRFRKGLSHLPKDPTANNDHPWAKVPSWAFSQCLVEITWVRSLLSVLLLMMSPDCYGTGAKELMIDVLPRFGADKMSQKRECPRRHRWCPMKEMLLRKPTTPIRSVLNIHLCDSQWLKRSLQEKMQKVNYFWVAPKQWTN